MNIFSKLAKLFLILFASVLFIGGVTELQLIGLELMNKPDTLSFYLGVLYEMIVIFILGSTVYFIVDYLKGLNKKDSKEEQSEQVTNNK
jgi:hypothetical protein